MISLSEIYKLLIAHLKREIAEGALLALNFIN